MPTTNKSWAELFIVAFFLNYLWESWHAVYLYHGFAHPPLTYVRSLPEFLHLITRVSLTDAVLITVIALLGVSIWRDWSWFTHPTTQQYSFFIAAALVVAIAIEIKGVYLFKQWSYSPLMPTLFGLGVSPLLQLAVTGLIAMRWLRSAHEHGSHLPLT
ncbi:MAG: hypothetical protein WD972_02925 [Candidatus Andersenbacteria bacterium]